MTIQGFYLMPHPPIIIPEVGKGKEAKILSTSENLYKIGREIEKIAPETIIIVTPHGTMFQDAISLVNEDNIQGSLKNFGVPQVSMNLQVNKVLTERIHELAIEENIPTVMISNTFLKSYKSTLSLDHGVIVPLYFVNKYYNNYKIVHITYAPLNDMSLYKFGIILKRAVEELKEKTVFIASGDLSHRLKEDGPYEYSPFGEKFDTEFLNNLKAGDVCSLFKMDEETVCSAGECGRKSAFIMLGALDCKRFNGELLSYEGTFGVGYGVMKLNILGEEESKLKELEEIKNLRYSKKLNHQDAFVRLARESLTHFLTTGEQLKELPDYVTEEMRQNKRGVFVSLKKYRELRGCIGTISPTTNSIAEEIIRNAIEAATQDPRFSTVEESELLDLDFSVDVLTESVTASKEELDPKRYGVIVTRKGRRGLLLPDLEGVNTVEEQLSIALKKAGISSTEPYTIEKFEVIRHKE
ncbi:MAG: AmmeMemoRadiSam system protein A [Clostridiaceae bacterium]|nr:AmmeMemoRadiSam system protein A [Clostridiaceae bacterium]